jgi:hypothetical protein
VTAVGDRGAGVAAGEVRVGGDDCGVARTTAGPTGEVSGGDDDTARTKAPATGEAGTPPCPCVLCFGVVYLLLMKYMLQCMFAKKKQSMQL